MEKKLTPAELKIALLCNGLDFNIDAFKNIKREFYENQFVYNITSKGVQNMHRFPQVLCLEDKVVSALLRRPESKWGIEATEEDILITYEGGPFSIAQYPEKPAYFGKRLSNGLLSDKVIAVAGAETPGFFFYPDCTYFDRGVPCKFCPIRGTRRTVGKEMVSDFSQELIAEATRLFQRTPWRGIKIISITTGTFPDNDNGARYTSSLVRAIYDALEPKIPIHLLTMPPNDLDIINEYKDAGATTLAFNLEVFNEELFKEICPGKEQYYGYKPFIQSFDVARKIFGDYNIFCGFIWGLEPTKSTIEGYEYFLDRGVSISSNVFHADPKSVYANRPHPSEEVVRELCEAQTELHHRYPGSKPIFPCSMRSTLDYEIYRGDFK